MIVPERKNRRKREEMLAALKKGDKVMTNGGMYATIVGVQDNVVTLQIAEGVRVRFSRQAIQALAEEEPEKKTD
jgi:preprotein translocase subunit YajC